ncbi:LacI family DNA-binding transcriptional regulator [Agreia bicolorata]|uniref:LacI family transcriptional regulator n=1 Tax=Agreia bicolorata TaxID=110935 RepID=A0ABR5CDS4_9MICO|nr:LacI family DNA-binding transcriptional regulator [Agreia bicolorata]KJC63637.1 LacI family transcriptional regulator [Agreia bicolorata]
MKPATLRDVAAAAGVHPGTASRALNSATQNLVNRGTVARVIKVAAELGYQPNPIARSLKTSKTGTIGIVIPDLTNPFFPPIVRGIESILEPAGYSGLLVSTDGDLSRERTQVAALRARQVEGLIIATALLDHPLLEELGDMGVLTVMVNRRPHLTNAPSVIPDDAAGIRLAVEHLASLGHRRIAHLAGPANTSTGVARARAFQDAVADLDLVSDPRLIVTCKAWNEDAGAHGLRELLATSSDFTAVVAGNDLIALGCYDVFAERGIDCPREISVVGMNDMPFLDKLRPPLTTVAVPHRQLGEESARLMLDLLREPDRPIRSVTLPVSLVVRASTAVVSDMNIAARDRHR